MLLTKQFWWPLASIVWKRKCNFSKYNVSQQSPKLFDCFAEEKTSQIGLEQYEGEY